VLVSVMTNDNGLDTRIRGEYGTIEVADHLTIREQRDWWPEFRKLNAGWVQNDITRADNGDEKVTPPPGEGSFVVHSSPRPDHMGSFLGAIRGENELTCNVELGCSTMVAIKMGVEAYRKNKVLLWDAAAERVVES
jgi:hypothetical protein